MTTTSDRTSDGGPPTGAAPQDDLNRVEELLVRHLMADVTDTLTDRPGTVHQFPWSPAQRVRVGVLAPTWVASPAEEGEPEEESGSGTQAPVVIPPIENRGVIGLDFLVDDSPAELELQIEVTYALYHPLIPSFAVVAAEAATRAAAAAGNTRRRPTVPVEPAWARDNRHVSLTVRVPTGNLEAEATSSALPGGDPLAADAQVAVSTHYALSDALWPMKTNQTLPVAEALGTEAQFRQALLDRRDPAWQPVLPEPLVTVTTMPTVDGATAVAVSLTNALEQHQRQVQDLSLYDATLNVQVHGAGQLRVGPLGLADDDCRYKEAATVPGRGRGCVAVLGTSPNSVRSETLPVHVQHESRSSDHGVDIRFSSLAGSFMPALESIATAMRSFLRRWDFGAASTPAERGQLEELRKRFEEEVDRFELGCDLLRADPRLSHAFSMANEAFALAKPQPDAGWRLFQLAFIITELGALAGRENPTDPRLRAELDSVDVLWFPTGGGKTEAYLGLITVGLFFDRLRGKERGTTAWMLFPLRMLSVQQLARICHVLHHAEQVRLAQQVGGDQFALGYLVGSRNTPNRLATPGPHWPGITEFAKLNKEERDERRLLGACPRCGDKNNVGLDVDLADERLLHVCRACTYTLPIYASDDEVTRYLPAVLVSTVDKITSLARNGELTALNRGPRRGCPKHGWYTHDKCRASNCDTDQTTHVVPTGFYDTTPALWIQDELHLVREELGVFAGHYHTLVAELARGAGHEPSKVIAATATIEQFEDQLSQVYGRTPRLFPAGGPSLNESFYSATTANIRRLYLGVLPAGGGTVKVDLASTITTHLVQAVHHLTDDPAPLIASLAAEGVVLGVTEARALLFDYELVLAYVNSKAHGVEIQDDLNRLSEELMSSGSDRIRNEYLMGDTPLGELAAAVATIEDPSGLTRSQRIRALIGTSVVSHGVDLERLNWEVLAGMPSSYAHYIQATARAGRTHVGLVVSVFDRSNRRETSMFQSFETMHAALDRMVEPVPVNRFAARAVNRTLPGIVCALLWDETRNPNWPSVAPISTTRNFKPWWNTNAANLLSVLAQRLERAYRYPVPDPAVHIEEQKLVDDALARWEQIERPRMQGFDRDWLNELFQSPVMTSLRDVDTPVEFSGGNNAEKLISRLY